MRVPIMEDDQNMAKLPEKGLQVGRAREWGGTVLGVTIGRRIVDTHQGERYVEGEVSTSSLFQVRVPLLQG
jgi:signal transduction histidine kinase